MIRNRLEGLSAAFSILPHVRRAREARRREALEESYQVSLQRAIEEVRKDVTPETLTNYWRARLQLDGFRIGLDIQVPDCDWTEEAIKEPMVDINGKVEPGLMIFKPMELSGREGLVRLDKISPGKQNEPFQMSVNSLKPSATVHDKDQNVGWIKVERTSRSPNLNTTARDLDNHARKTGYTRQFPSTYRLASRASLDLFDVAFDQDADTASRLYGGFCGSKNGKVFDSNKQGLAYEDMIWKWYMTTSDGRDQNLGGRFEMTRANRS